MTYMLNEKCLWKTSNTNYVAYLEVYSDIKHDYRKIEKCGGIDKTYFYYKIDEGLMNDKLREYGFSEVCKFLERKGSLLSDIKNNKIVERNINIE